MDTKICRECGKEKNFENFPIFKKKNKEYYRLVCNVPQSKLLYTSMEDENFIKCWSLNNLRPYHSKQNLLDGDRK